MTTSIKVRVVRFSNRKYFMLQWTDPASGLKRTRSSGIEVPVKGRHKKARDEAAKSAKELEDKLKAGLIDRVNISWQDFRQRYEDEELSGLAANTFVKVQGLFNKIERIVKPRRLSDLNEDSIGRFIAALREEGLAESTIASLRAHLRALLSFAVDRRLMTNAPKVSKIKRAKTGTGKMKGRPITTEEFERMLAATEKVVGPKRAPSWRYYLEGLWHSGLRLRESLELSWDWSDNHPYVDLSGTRPMLQIPGNSQKSGKDQSYPITPDFAELLLKTPVDDRKGHVFHPAPARGSSRLNHFRVSELIVEIGKKAGVKVAESASGKIKYASAHDLRRAFGERWAHRVPAQVLQTLMRHASISTTLRYYVNMKAQSVADQLWEQHASMTGGSQEAAKCEAKSNTLGNTSSNQHIDQ